MGIQRKCGALVRARRAADAEVDDWGVLDTLEALVDRSLLVASAWAPTRAERSPAPAREVLGPLEARRARERVREREVWVSTLLRSEPWARGAGRRGAPKRPGPGSELAPLDPEAFEVA